MIIRIADGISTAATMRNVRIRVITLPQARE